MAAEGTGGSKLAELVTDHILGNVYRNVLSAVMNSKCVSRPFRSFPELF